MRVLVHFGEKFMKMGDGFYPFIEVDDIKLLVRRMQVIAVQSKSHKYNFQAQFFFKKGADGNTAASSYRYRFFPESGFYRLSRRFIRSRINRRHIRLAS